MSIHCCAKSIPYNGTAVIVLRFIRYELYYIVFSEESRHELSALKHRQNAMEQWTWIGMFTDLYVNSYSSSRYWIQTLLVCWVWL